MEGPKERTDAEERLYQEQQKEQRNPDTRHDWYGDDEHDPEKDRGKKTPLEEAVEAEKKELRYRRPDGS